MSNTASLSRSRQLYLIRRALGMIWGASRNYTLAWLLLLAVLGLIPPALVFLTKLIVDALAVAESQKSGLAGLWPAAAPIALMGGLLIAQRAIAGFLEWINTMQSELIGDHIKRLVHTKAAELDYADFESPEFYDTLAQANGAASGSVLSLLQTLGSFLGSLVTLGSLIAVIAVYAWWLPLTYVAAAIPAFVVLMQYRRIYHTWWVQTTPARRWVQFFDMAQTNQAGAAELRVFDLGPYFRERYEALRSRLRGEQSRMVLRQAVGKLVAGVLAFLVTGLTMLWAVIRATNGVGSIGDLALFYQTFAMGQGVISAILQSFGSLATNTLYLQYLFTYLDRPVTLVDPPAPAPFPRRIEQGVVFDNVSFRYPDSDRLALDRFTLHLPAGKLSAIVGENGAGKSTFTKLLCRFYDPEAGAVRIDGQDVRRFRRADLLRNISLLTQWPIRYPFTAEENICIGDLRRAPVEADVIAAAEAGGAHSFLAALPRGYDTTLSRQFEDGVELSGGQWQRVTLARAIYRKAPLLVLDEPTSYMDSWTEISWVRGFKDLFQGRTAVLITHRFTTAMQADVIFVMHQGQVVESGSHAELLAAGGHYAASWHAQISEAGAGVAAG